jgi:hypothetical protein
MSAPDTSPSGVEQEIRARAHELFNHERDGGLFAPATVAEMLLSIADQVRALSSQLQDAHRHLGTALEMVKVCRSFKEGSFKRHGRWCANCGQPEEFHNQLAAARAYSRAHGGQE